jgi:hypothetical protein
MNQIYELNNENIQCEEESETELMSSDEDEEKRSFEGRLTKARSC